MFRKFAFALATTAALGTAALAPTTASAHGHFGHFGHRHGLGLGLGLGVAAGIVGAGVVADSCYQRTVVETPWGPRVRWVNVCY